MMSERPLQLSIWRSLLIPSRQTILIGELLGLFFLLPLGVWRMDPAGHLLMPALGAVLLLAGGIAWRNGATSESVGLGEVGRRRLWPCLLVGLLLWGAIVFPILFLQWLWGNSLLPMVHQRPGLFLMVSLIYPFSVVAQEFLFRGFFFWRYASLLPQRTLLWINIAAFGWLHIVYGYWVSVMLAVLAGTLLAVLYLHYRTLWGIMFIHALLGLSLFAGGLGHYFFKESGSHETRMDDRGGSDTGPGHSRAAGRHLVAGAAGEVN
jgi:uncharacterized protein